MPTNQITGQTTDVTLTAAAYGNPLTVTATGTISGTSDGIAASGLF